MFIFYVQLGSSVLLDFFVAFVHLRLGVVILLSKKSSMILLYKWEVRDREYYKQKRDTRGLIVVPKLHINFLFYIYVCGEIIEGPTKSTINILSLIHTPI